MLTYGHSHGYTRDNHTKPTTERMDQMKFRKRRLFETVRKRQAEKAHIQGYFQRRAVEKRHNPKNGRKYQ